MFRAADVPKRFGSYTCEEELGRGAFAVVFGCRKAGARERLAAKAFDLRFLRTSAHAAREVKKLQREASILKQVPSHPNIVRFVDIVQEGSEWLFFVLEFVAGGDLMKTMLKRPGKRPRLLEPEALYVFKQLVEGLGWLHTQGVIHRDLKLENVLVVRTREVGDSPSLLLLDVKITDFGLSRFVGPEFSEPMSTVGSPRYMAPEVKGLGAHHLPADFWSLGILLSILIGGKFPCDGLPHVPQSKLDDAVQKLPASSRAQSVVIGLLQLRPEARMTIVQLRKHIWLTAGPSEGPDVSRSVATSDGASKSSSSSQAKRPKVAAESKSSKDRRVLGRSKSEDRHESKSKELSIWTKKDNQKVTSAIAEVTDFIDGRRKLPQPSVRERMAFSPGGPRSPAGARSPALSDKTFIISRDDFLSTPSKSSSTPPSKSGRGGTAALANGRDRGRASSSAGRGSSLLAITPQKAPAKSGGAARSANTKKAAASTGRAKAVASNAKGRGTQSKAPKAPAPKAMKKADKAEKPEKTKGKSEKTVMKRPAKAEPEVMKRPAKAGSVAMKRPASAR